MNWAAAETAIRSVVVSASGLASDHVIWSQQDGPTPSGQFIALRFVELARVGQDFVYYDDNPAPVAGEELRQRTLGDRRVTLSITCFAGSATGDAMPVAIVDKVAAAFHSPQHRATLSAQGVGMLSTGPIRSIDGIVSFVKFEARATVEIYLSMVSELVAYETVIEHVEITNQIPDPDNTFVVDAPIDAMI